MTELRVWVRIWLRELTPILRASYRRLGIRCDACRVSCVRVQLMSGVDIVADYCRPCGKRMLKQKLADSASSPSEQGRNDR